MVFTVLCMLLRMVSDSMFINQSIINQSTNQLSYAISTQFEHIRARAMFPSFDEPEYNTPFTISVEHSNDLTAISNGDVETTEELG